MWPRSTAAETARLEADIVQVRTAQLALQHQRDDAVSTEVRALAMLDAARAIQDRCGRLIEEHAAAIGSLQDELAALLPKQWKGQT